MATQKVIKRRDDAAFEEVETVDTSSGVGDAGAVVSLGDGGYLDPSLLPPGVAADQLSVLASETLAAGDFVNLWDDAGTVKARKADNTTGRRADGYVLTTVLADAPATIHYDDQNDQLTSLTPGTVYYLGTAGGVTDTKPVGQLVQQLGKAVTATMLQVDTGDQTAATVPVTPTGNLAASNVQDALDELQGDIDARRIGYPHLKETGGAINTELLADITNGRVAVGSIVQTAAYWDGTDLGGATYRVVAAATGTDDGGSYIDAGTVQLEAMFDKVRSVAAYGANNDSDASKVQAAFDASPAGGEVRFPPGTYDMDATTTVADKTISIVADHGAELVVAHATTVPTIDLNNADGSRIHGLKFTASDTIAYYDTNYATITADHSPYSCIRLVDTDDYEIDGIVTTNRYVGISVTNSDRGVIRRTKATGLGTGFTNLSNLHIGVDVDNCSDVTIEDAWSQDVGNGVLIGGRSQRIRVVNSTGLDTTDNTFYLSSADHSTIVGCTAIGSTGAGVKIRGNGNSITNSVFEGVDIGISTSAYTTEEPGVGSGFGAYGLTISNVMIKDTVQPAIWFRTLGGTTYYHQGVFVSDVFIMNACTSDPAALGAIHGTLEESTLQSIRIDGSGSYGIYLIGAGNSATMSGNTFRDIHINDVAQMAARLTHQVGALVDGVRIRDNTNVEAFYMRDCQSCDVFNVQTDSGRVREYSDCDDMLWANISSFGVPNWGGTNRRSWPTAIRAAGTTSLRPTAPYDGEMFYDTLIDKPVWWDGSGWVDVDGTTA